MNIAFTVFAEPKPAPRPRFGSHAYMQRRYRAYQEPIIAAAKNAMHGREPMAGQVTVAIDCYFEIPKSWTKKKKYDAAVGAFRPTGHNLGDVDNIMKGILDSCNGIVFQDDSQVVDVTLRKFYSSTAPYIKVFVND